MRLTVMPRPKRETFTCVCKSIRASVDVPPQIISVPSRRFGVAMGVAACTWRDAVSASGQVHRGPALVLH